MQPPFSCWNPDSEETGGRAPSETRGLCDNHHTQRLENSFRNCVRLTASKITLFHLERTPIPGRNYWRTGAEPRALPAEIASGPSPPCECFPRIGERGKRRAEVGDCTREAAVHPSGDNDVHDGGC